MVVRTSIVLLMALSTVGLSGCSTVWNQVGKFSGFMAEETAWVKLPSLRGSKEAQPEDVKMAEVTPTTYMTDVTNDNGSDYIYIDTTSQDMTSTKSYDESGSVPCPDGTYLTEDDVCMLLGGDDEFISDMDYSSSDFTTESGYVDTSQVACPDGTYLNDKNQCMFLEQDDNAALFTQ